MRKSDADKAPLHPTQRLTDLLPPEPVSNRRVVVSRFGGPEVLELVEEVLPEPAAGEVRVRTIVAGVAYGDVQHRRGLLAPRLPFTPGYDVAGLVDKLGEGVSGVEVGRTVVALTPVLGQGGYADFICLPADALLSVPPEVDPADAVSLALNYTAALQMIERLAKVQAGERVVVHGAAGGMGTALVQLARLAGAVVFGTASGGKHPVLRELGATPIDYRSEDVGDHLQRLTQGEGVDVVFDAVGGEHWRESYRSLRAGGRLVTYGQLDVARAGFAAQTLEKLAFLAQRVRSGGGRQVLPYQILDGTFSTRENCLADLARLLDLLRAEKVLPLIGKRVPLGRASQAHQMLENAEVCGKIVLLCNV